MLAAGTFSIDTLSAGRYYVSIGMLLVGYEQPDVSLPEITISTIYTMCYGMAVSLQRTINPRSQSILF